FFFFSIASELLKTFFSAQSPLLLFLHRFSPDLSAKWSIGKNQYVARMALCEIPLEWLQVRRTDVTLHQ
ncbi:MAG: hypothetical protein O7C56_04810, partial [Rickettsia endosymbiont of Ixodes persulcatus]|nr:hypothetical protein [Rickettsia endosymbiont of Ixodes persulcatus]